MLVLSRRESEQIRFPQLGITIEVLRTNCKKVRIGIDAPQEIKIIRGEIEESYLASPNHALDDNGDRTGQEAQSHDETAILNDLSAATLAIHLAQNQLSQHLNDNAESALENALDCLAKIESALADHSHSSLNHAVVRESPSPYKCNSQNDPWRGCLTETTSQAECEINNKRIALAI